LPQITDLTATTVVTDDDLFIIVDDPSGTHAAKKVTAANGRKYLGGHYTYVTGLVAGDVGTNATANLAALQAALDAAEAAGGGVVVIPPGIYQINGTANIGSRVTLAGTGWGSRLKLANSTSTTIAPKAVLAAKGNSNYLGVEDLYIDGNASNQADVNYASPGIDFYGRGTTETSSAPLYDGGLFLHRVMVYNCKGVGFYVRGDATTMRISDCYSYHNQSEGFWMKSDFEIHNCIAANNGGEGFRVYSGTSARLTACKGFGNGFRYDASDFLVHYTESVMMSDCQSEDSRWRGFTFTSVRYLSATNLVAYRSVPEQAESSAFWVEDDTAGGICTHFYLEGAVRAGGGAGAFAHALTTRELGTQVEIRLKTNTEFTGTKWRHISGSTSDAIVALDNGPAFGRPEEITVAISDETTSLTTGTAKLTMRMPFAMKLTAVRANLNTASSSGIPTFDINEGGTTILSTKLTIDATEKTSTTAATAAVISDSALADDAEITFDVDVAGTGAKGAKITLIGTRA
jgi:hypothetical protein